MPDSSKKRNAFGVLMTKPRKSRFVVCPAGCGRHIPDCNVNRHLDECILREDNSKDGTNNPGSITSADDVEATAPVTRIKEVSQEQVEEKIMMPPSEEGPPKQAKEIESTRALPSGTIKSPDKVPPLLSNLPGTGDACSTKPGSGFITSLETGCSVTPDTALKKQSSVATRDPREASAADADTTTCCNSNTDTSEENLPPAEQPSSLFSRMMKSSKLAFSAPQSVKQTLYMNSDLSVFLLTGTQSPPGTVVWSETVQLKKGINRPENEEKQLAKFVDLTVCTGLPPAPEETVEHRWMRRHSRLSVPVLKSILQKSIRRRRPLPAVRVAMELLDKAPEELFRRLPIIAVEDSTLHPDIPLLVCLMIMASKGFRIPANVLTRVLQIVYEIASCPYRDSFPLTTDDSFRSPLPSLFTLDDEPVLWALLARASYGGMAGDIRMLQQFAHLWQERFTELVPQLPPEVKQITSWRAVPTRIHAAAKSKVESLIPHQLDCLQMHDITLEGIDFHCSNIIAVLARDTVMIDLCHDLLVLASESPVPSAPTSERNDWILDKWKSTIWKFSAGVNRRRPLLPTNQASSQASSNSMWDQLLKHKVEAFQLDYVQARLVR